MHRNGMSPEVVVVVALVIVVVVVVVVVVVAAVARVLITKQTAVVRGRLEVLGILKLGSARSFSLTHKTVRRPAAS